MPRVTLIQFKTEQENRLNLEKATRFIKSASGKSNLIVFPELFMKGEFDEEDEKEFVGKFSDLAKENRIDIVPGSIIEIKGKMRYNTSYYIDKKGRVLCKYRKNNPWKSEKVEKGSIPKSFNTVFGKTSLIICWDLSDPRIAARLASYKANLVICPSLWWAGSNSGSGKRDFAASMIDALCSARAYECRCAIAYVNAAGRLKLDGFSDMSAGASQVTLPFQGPIKRAKGAAEQALSSEIDLKVISRAKRYFG